MEPRRLQVYVPGILTFPGSADNWSGKAVTHTHASTEYYAEKCEFLVGPIDRAFGQKERSEKLQKLLSYYVTQWNVNLVGHSNGADVIVQTLRWRQLPFSITQLHLICGACGADFENNGLNNLLKDGVVEKVFIYVAGKDLALRLAHTIPGKLLGYGTLGLKGPVNVAPSISSRVKVITDGPWSNYGHGDCFDTPNFVQTMHNFLQ